jgi:hypothetical protein
MTKKI